MIRPGAIAGLAALFVTAALGYEVYDTKTRLNNLEEANANRRASIGVLCGVVAESQELRGKVLNQIGGGRRMIAQLFWNDAAINLTNDEASVVEGKNQAMIRDICEAPRPPS